MISPFLFPDGETVYRAGFKPALTTLIAGKSRQYRRIFRAAIPDWGL
jgi:hypothetical protein